MITASPQNPFETIKVRIILLGFVVIWVLMGLVYGALGSLNLLPLPPGDPIVAPVFYILIFSSLCLGLVWWSRRSSMRLPALWGTWPPELSWGELGLLVAGLFLFSLGAFQLSYLLLSWIAPELVQSTLQESLLLTAEDTGQPGLYNSLILLSALVVAPLAEEFIFRGFLLHRWGSKWGIRVGLIGSSLVFGILHSNLLGLFVFGLVMSLLYLRSRCLLVPVVAHALNNAIASGLDFWSSRLEPEIPVNPLMEFRASWWLGVLCLLISTPWIWRFIRRNWPQAQQGLPYFVNVEMGGHKDG